MANKVTIEVEARFVDDVTKKSKAVVSELENVEEAAEEAQQDLDRLGKKKVDPDIDADNTKFNKKVKDSESKADKLGRKKVKSTFDADNNKFLKKLMDSESKAARLAGKTFSTTLKVLDKGTSIVNKMESGLKKIAGKTWTTVVKIKDLATAPLRGIKNTLFSVKSLVMAITAGLAAKQLVATPISLADAYSSAKIGFQTLLGEQQGQQMMNDLDDFAKATPFKSSEVIGQTQRMLAMGWDAENIIDDMTTIGDAAAATGKGEMGLQQIVTALAQIKTKGKLSTEELNQLAEAGISAKKYIAEGLGYGSGDEGIAKMTKDLEDGAIQSGKALEALLSGMQEYKGMMDRTANETVEGLWSQIQDTFEINIFRKWGQGLQDGAKKSFGSIVSLIEEADGALTNFGDTLYEAGKIISNWLADKLEKTVQRITDITDSFEFKNASLGEKFKMLWKGVISDPLKEWWDGGGQQKTAETAGKIGSWMGEMLTKGLLAIFGATDILDDGIGTGAGSSIAGSFLQGFLDNFDGQAITDAFVDAIKNVWNALPTWAKWLIGGYAGGKAITGIGNVVGGIANIAGGITSFIGSRGTIGAGNVVTGASGLLGVIGRTGVAGVGSSGILGGLANTGYSLMGGTSALSVGGGMAALAGGASIAGGLAGGAAAIKGGIDLYGAYKAHKAGDKTEAKAKAASGGSALGGVGAGAAIGAGIGSIIPGVGTAIGGLVGAGIGGIAGWIGGSKWAKKIRKDAEAAKYESEECAKIMADTEASLEEKQQAYQKAVYESMQKRFDGIKLSMSEIERLANQIVWGDDIANFDKFTAATKNAEANLQALKDATANTEKWLWKASLGVKFNDDEKESIKASFDDFINSAKSYVENKHYEFTAAVSLLVDVESEEGKDILKTSNAFYEKMQKQLDDLGSKLSKSVDIALKDGVITLDEQKEIANLQQQIADITNKIASAEQKAELELIKVKFGGGKLDLDSFDSFMQQMETTIQSRMEASDKAFTTSVSSLNLQLEEGAITKEQYDKQIKALIDGYNSQIESLQVEVKDVELKILGESYAEDLKVNAEVAAVKFQNALESAMKKGVDPIEWSDAELCKILGVDSLDEDVAGGIKQMLSQVLSQLSPLEVKTEADVKVEKVTAEEGTGEKVESVVKKELPDFVNGEVEIKLLGEKTIEPVSIVASEFGIPESEAETIIWNLNGKKNITEQITYLAKEFGINKEEASTILWSLTGQKGPVSKITISAGDFGIKNNYSFSPTVTVSPVFNGSTASVSDKLLGLDGQGYRGGIFGGPSAMDSFARGGIPEFPDGGIVGGSIKYIRVNEESPEMIIPLSSQRRGRALKLWAQAGRMMDVPGFARGGITRGGNDEGIRFGTYESDEGGGQTVQIDVGGITVEIHVDATGHENIAEAIKEQSAEIAEAVAGIMADAFTGQFENTLRRGGVA